MVVASVVNKSFAAFLAAQPRPDPSKESKLYARPLSQFMRAGLQRLADMKGDPEIVKRDFLSPLSFSCVAPETQKNQEEMMAKFIRGQQTAFSPLGSDGRPMRK